MQVSSPKSDNFLRESHLDELAKHYSIDLKTEEVLVARNILACKTEAGCPPRDMIAVHNLLDSDMFPSLNAIIQVVGHLGQNERPKTKAHDFQQCLSVVHIRQPANDQKRTTHYSSESSMTQTTHEHHPECLYGLPSASQEHCCG